MVVVFYIRPPLYCYHLMLAEEGMTEQKKNTAEKIDGSIGRANQKFDERVNNVIDSAAAFIATLAQTYNIPNHIVKGGGIIVAAVGAFLAVSVGVTFKTGYYASEAGGLWMKLLIGVAILAGGIAVWRAGKQLETGTSALKAKPKAPKPVKHKAAATPEAKVATSAKNADISWLVYAISAALAIFLILKPASSIWVWQIQQEYALFVWGWVAITGVYAWYRFQGGKWTLNLGGFPLTLIIFAINIGLVFLLFMQYP